MTRFAPDTILSRKRYPGDERFCTRIDEMLRLPASPNERIVLEGVYALVGFCTKCGQPIYTGNIRRRSPEQAGTFHTCLCAA